MDRAIYTAGVTVNPKSFMFTSTLLDLPHHMGTMSMGKRIQTDEPANFGQRLAELRKAAGFAQVELAAGR